MDREPQRDDALDHVRHLHSVRQPARADEEHDQPGANPVGNSVHRRIRTLQVLDRVDNRLHA